MRFPSAVVVVAIVFVAVFVPSMNAYADGADSSCAPCKCGDGCKKPAVAKPKKPKPTCCETLRVKERLAALEARLAELEDMSKVGRKEFDDLADVVKEIRLALMDSVERDSPESLPIGSVGAPAELAELRARLDELTKRLAALPKAKSVVTVGIESSFLWTPKTIALLGGPTLVFRTPGSFEIAVRAGYEALSSGTFVGGSIDWLAPKPVRLLGVGVTVTGAWTHVFDSPGNSAKRQILAFGLGPRLRVEKWDLVFGVDALVGDDRDATSSVIFFGVGAHVVTTFDLDF
ncbi:MAG: hypothetical protein AAB562_01135 [Patescibacteria group bacterium]